MSDISKVEIAENDVRDIKDIKARGFTFESMELAQAAALAGNIPDGANVFIKSTAPMLMSASNVEFDDSTAQLGASDVQEAIEKAAESGGSSVTVVEELDDIVAMETFNGEAAGAKAVKTLRQAFSDALTALKATPIAQAVGAAVSDTFTQVITKLNSIVNRGAGTKTIGTTGTSTTIDAGYYDGTGTVSIDKVKTSGQSNVTVAGNWGAGNTSGYVYLDSGWYPQDDATYGCWSYITQAQAQACHVHSAQGYLSSNANHDLGINHSYRYINVSVAPSISQVFYYNTTANGQDRFTSKSCTVVNGAYYVIGVLQASHAGSPGFSGCTRIGTSSTYWHFTLNANTTWYAWLTFVKATSTTITVTNMAGVVIVRIL